MRQFGRGQTTGSILLVKQDGRKRKCIFCNREHVEMTCKNIEDPEERKELLVKQGCCFMCLYKGHRAFKCRFKSLCKLCKHAEHHVSLCSSSNNAISFVDVPLLRSNAPPGNLSNATSCEESTGYGGELFCRPRKLLL